MCKPLTVPMLAFSAMTDDELAALEHANWIAYLTGVGAAAPGGPR